MYKIKFQNLKYNPKENGYYNFKKLKENADSKSMSVCEFLQEQANTCGCFESVISKIKSFVPKDTLGDLNALEIGGGTGCFIEETIKQFKIKNYESYEVHTEWSEYITQRYNLIQRKCNGYNLNGTADNSIKLLLSHGVFVYLPFRVTLSYFHEIIRVSDRKAVVVFDYYSFEDMLTDKQESYFKNNPNTYQVFLDDLFVKNFFSNHNYRILGEFYFEEAIGRGEKGMGQKYIVLQSP